ATYAFIFDHKGEITDAYERTVSAGEVKIKKVDPKKLLDTVRATLKG
ncbi:MAG TPA: hypothetical protein HPQ00_15745, partial [Magnetococcales bacterium]|nr:hypothetical protein [Magnetococcales bacterium]